MQQEIANLQKKASQLVQQQVNIQNAICSEQYSVSKSKSPQNKFYMQQKIVSLRSKLMQVQKSESDIRKNIFGKQINLENNHTRLQQEIRYLNRQIQRAKTQLPQSVINCPVSRSFSSAQTTLPKQDSEIVELIQQGESATLEFKSSARWNLREKKKDKMMENIILKTVAAFLNSEGGTLLIGVADDGNVIGLKHDYQTLKKPNRDGYGQFLTQLLLRENFGLYLSKELKFSFHKIGQDEVCKVSIYKSPRPIYLKPKNPQEEQFWIRSGNSTHKLSVSETVNYCMNNFKTIY